MDKSSSIWLPRSISIEACRYILTNHHNNMYSAGVPVPQGYHITVANSFSRGTISPGFEPLTSDLVPGGTRFEGVVSRNIWSGDRPDQK